MKGLSEIDLPVNTILVSDHGMSELIQAPETYIFLNELININDSAIRISHSRALTHFYVKNPIKVDSLYNVLKQQENNYSVLRKKDLPAHWQYQHARVGDLLMVAKPNHSIQINERAELLQNITLGNTFGVHGYDPLLVKDMRGIFYAQGPNIKVGVKIPAFQNIDVYPLVAKILNLQLPPIDGNPKTLKKVYKK
jgi:alkaline phosphatase D